MPINIKAHLKKYAQVYSYTLCEYTRSWQISETQSLKYNRSWQISDAHSLRVYSQLAVNLLKRAEKSITLLNLSVYYRWKNIENLYNNNKFKISAPTRNDKLPDGSCSVSNIQNYFKYILKKHGENIDKLSVKIYVNKIENRITLKIKNEYSLEILRHKTIKLLGSTENEITKDKK